MEYIGIHERFIDDEEPSGAGDGENLLKRIKSIKKEVECRICPVTSGGLFTLYNEYPYSLAGISRNYSPVVEKQTVFEKSTNSTEIEENDEETYYDTDCEDKLNCNCTENESSLEFDNEEEVFEEAYYCCSELECCHILAVDETQKNVYWENRNVECLPQGDQEPESTTCSLETDAFESENDNCPICGFNCGFRRRWTKLFSSTSEAEKGPFRRRFEDLEKESFNLPFLDFKPYEEEDFSDRIFIRTLRGFNRYRPYSGQTMQSSLSRDSDEQYQVDKRKLLNTVIGKSRQKLLKKLKVDQLFMCPISSVMDVSKIPKAKHKTQRIKYILEIIHRSERLYKTFKHALKITGQNRLLNYLQEQEWEIGLSDENDIFFVKEEVKRLSTRSYYEEITSNLEKRIKMKKVLDELSLKTRDEGIYDSMFRTHRPSVVQNVYRSDRLSEFLPDLSLKTNSENVYDSFYKTNTPPVLEGDYRTKRWPDFAEMNYLENRISGDSHEKKLFEEKRQILWDERRYQENEQKSIGSSTKSRSGWLFDTINFGGAENEQKSIGSSTESRSGWLFDTINFGGENEQKSIGSSTESRSGWLFDTINFGGGLKGSLKVLLVISLFSSAVGESCFGPGNISISSAVGESRFEPCIICLFPEAFNQSESCYQWQKMMKVGTYLPPELPTRHLDHGLDIGFVAWNSSIEQKVDKIQTLDSFIGEFKIHIPILVQETFFGEQDLKSASRYRDFKLFHGNYSNYVIKSSQLPKFPEDIEYLSMKSWNIVPTAEEQVLKDCYLFQLKALEEVKQRKEVIILPEHSIVQSDVTFAMPLELTEIQPMHSSEVIICFLQRKYEHLIAKMHLKELYLHERFTGVIDTRMPEIQFHLVGRRQILLSNFSVLNTWKLKTLWTMKVNLLDELQMLDLLLLYRSSEVITLPLFEECCYCDRFYHNTEKSSNILHIENDIFSCYLEFFSLGYVMLHCLLVFFCSFYVFHHVTGDKKETMWFVYRKIKISDPVTWIFFKLHTAQTSDLIWLWGELLSYQSSENAFKNIGQIQEAEDKNEDQEGIQEMCQSVDLNESIIENCKAKQNVDVDDELETKTVEYENNEVHSLLGKHSVKAEDIERERKFKEHQQLVDLVYGTENNEEETHHEELVDDDGTVIPVHKVFVQKGFKLSKTEGSFSEYNFCKEIQNTETELTLQKTSVSKPCNAFANKRGIKEFKMLELADSKKDHDKPEVKNSRYTPFSSPQRRVKDEQDLISSSVYDKSEETKLVLREDVHLQTLEEASKAYVEKENINSPNFVKTGPLKGKLRLSVITCPIPLVKAKPDVHPDLDQSHGQPSLIELDIDSVPDVKSKTKGLKTQKKKSYGVFNEAELAVAVRDYTWLPLNELPVPEVDITVAYVPQFEPLMSIIDQIANGTPPTPHISMRYELLRFCTLRSYPKENKPYLIKLAQAGFYYASDGDGVVCYCCGVRRYNWTADDIPMKIHQRINPNCKFLKKNDEVNVPVQYYGPLSKGLMAIMEIPEPRERSEVSEDVNNDWAPERVGSQAPAQQNRPNETGANSLGINTALPKHTQYATKTAREASYSGWPDIASHTPQELADAGFFYAGFGDCVRCFYCGIGLRHWTQDDDPWIEHARWSKNCVFIKQKKGEEFVNLVQLAVQYSQDNAAQTSGSAGNQLPGQEIERILLSDAAQSVLEMGYQPRIIKKAIEQILRLNGNGKITAQILMEKVLEIEEADNPSQTTPPPPAASAELPPVKPATQTAKYEVEKTAEGASAKSDKSETKETSDKENRPSIQDKDKKEATAKSAVKEDEGAAQDPKAIKAENEQLKEQTLCKVCLDNTVCIVFLPCGHLVTCADCAPAMRKCPICRALVKGTVRTYMS